MLIEYNEVNIYQADEMILEGVDFKWMLTSLYI